MRVATFFHKFLFFYSCISFSSISVGGSNILNANHSPRTQLNGKVHQTAIRLRSAHSHPIKFIKSPNEHIDSLRNIEKKNSSPKVGIIPDKHRTKIKNVKRKKVESILEQKTKTIPKRKHAFQKNSDKPKTESIVKNVHRFSPRLKNQEFKSQNVPVSKEESSESPSVIQNPIIRNGPSKDPSDNVKINRKTNIVPQIASETTIHVTNSPELAPRTSSASVKIHNAPEKDEKQVYVDTKHDHDSSIPNVQNKASKNSKGSMSIMQETDDASSPNANYVPSLNAQLNSSETTHSMDAISFTASSEAPTVLVKTQTPENLELSSEDVARDEIQLATTEATWSVAAMTARKIASDVVDQTPSNTGSLLPSVPVNINPDLKFNPDEKSGNDRIMDANTPEKSPKNKIKFGINQPSASFEETKFHKSTDRVQGSTPKSGKVTPKNVKMVESSLITTNTFGKGPLEEPRKHQLERKHPSIQDDVLKRSSKVNQHLNKLTLVITLGMFTAGLAFAMFGAFIKKSYGRARYLRHRLLVPEDELPILNEYHDAEMPYESWRNMETFS